MRPQQDGARWRERVVPEPKENPVTLPRTASRADWLEARKSLLVKEKELTRARDALSAERRRLPVVEVSPDYAFQGPAGSVRLVDLFDGRRQLILYHFMGAIPGYGWCPVCSFWIDNVGHPAHFHARDTTFVVDCPEPWSDVEAFVARMGWTVPFVSSHGTSFYEDFHVELGGAPGEVDAPGVSVFLREGDAVFHSYSTYRRGSDHLNGTYAYLDLTPLGRQEDHLEDKMDWMRLHDEY